MPKLSFVLLLSFLLSLSACNVDSDKSTTEDSTVAVTETIPVPPSKLCYMLAQNGDTVELSLTISPEKLVSGNLLYKLAGKDRNSGTIAGTMLGDTLKADYTFMAEGKESVRALIFLKQDSVLTEGYGSMEEVNGKMQFKSGSAIDFSKGLRLMLTNCKN